MSIFHSNITLSKRITKLNEDWIKQEKNPFTPQYYLVMKIVISMFEPLFVWFVFLLVWILLLQYFWSVRKSPYWHDQHPKKSTRTKVPDAIVVGTWERISNNKRLDSSPNKQISINTRWNTCTCSLAFRGFVCKYKHFQFTLQLKNKNFWIQFVCVDTSSKNKTRTVLSFRRRLFCWGVRVPTTFDFI